MKVELTKGKTFTPVSMTITCESQDEVDALGCLGNQAYLGDCFREVFGIDLPNKIYDAMVNSGASYAKHSLLCNAISRKYASQTRQHD